MARKLNLDSQIKFVERFLSHQELARIYGHADVFVHPSRIEQFNLAVLETMACGAPVITSDIPVLKEELGEAGMTVEVGSVDALTEALGKVVENRALCDELSRRSLERAKTLTWRRYAEQLLALFNEAYRN